MAKKRPYTKKRGKGFRAIPFNKSLTLSTLGTGIVVETGLLDTTFVDRSYCISMDVYAMKRNGTVGEGPLIWGVAHGDLSVAEIAEALSAGGPSRDDIIEREQASRPVRKCGIFPQIAGDEVQEDGKEIRKKIGFAVGQNVDLNLWCQSKASEANLTTGCSIQVMGTLYIKAMT